MAQAGDHAGESQYYREPGQGPPRWRDSDDRYAGEDERYRYRERQAPAWGYWGDDEEPGTPGARTARPAAPRGTSGSPRLTGMVLLVLFAAEGDHPGRPPAAHAALLSRHAADRPGVLKACSTIYRFARYYTGAAGYRRKGPPAPLLRLLGPFVLLTSLAVIGTGSCSRSPGPAAGIWLSRTRRRSCCGSAP